MKNMAFHLHVQGWHSHTGYQADHWKAKVLTATPYTVNQQRSDDP